MLVPEVISTRGSHEFNAEEPVSINLPLMTVEFD